MQEQAQDQDDVQHWIGRHLDGDPNAFESIYDLTILKVYKLVYFLIGRKAEADDIVQNVYTQLFRFFHTYDRARPFDKWLNGIVVRQVSDYKRKHWKLTRLLDKAKRFESAEEADFAGTVVDNVANELLLHQINALPLKYKTVLILHYLNGYTHAEVADLLGIPTGTVKSRLNAGLEKLRKKQAIWNLSPGKDVKDAWILRTK
ncbi:sigma-70 family RNA polymerase sigma factor [Cohnella yongneupensis]|uniref:Sigma-70 family RNA polymerase sigma factor n=1 Tax=Cohnella yongneupensis TaxID=425006 RepID=A0ABW0QZU8_9BACL